MNRQTQAPFEKVLGRRRFLLQQSAPTQIVREVFCRHAMEPSHPFLQSAGIRVHILHMKHFLAHPLLLPEVHRLMGDPLLPGNRLVSQGGHRCTEGRLPSGSGSAPASPWSGREAPHPLWSRVGPERSGRDLFFRQPAFRGFSASLPRRRMWEVPLRIKTVSSTSTIPWKVLSFASRILVRNRCRHRKVVVCRTPAPLRRFPERQAVLQGLGIHKPLFLVPKTGQRGPVRTFDVFRQARQ